MPLGSLEPKTKSSVEESRVPGTKWLPGTWQLSPTVLNVTHPSVVSPTMRDGARGLRRRRCQDPRDVENASRGPECRSRKSLWGVSSVTPLSLPGGR